MRPTVHDLDERTRFGEAVDAVALGYRCERCDVEPGTWCRTSSGRRAQHLHAPRADPAWKGLQWATQLGEREAELYNRLADGAGSGDG
jgi:hypothetical protein